MLELLKERFMKNPSLHPELVWEEVEESLKKNPDSLTILKKMEETGGEVNTIGRDEKTGRIIYCDCCIESPKGRRSLCYDDIALKSRKNNPPIGSVLSLVKGMNAKFTDYESFGDFLRWRFGKTLYSLYFEPYNKKVWRRDLNKVPMSWMEGKLPMPTTQEMRDNNANKVEEKTFVHSTFWYEKKNGSQYIVDKLADGLNIRYNVNIDNIKYCDAKWHILGETFDKVIFCGNIKDMVKMIEGVNIDKYLRQIADLEYHGTTSVFCEIDANPYSWIYQPSSKHESHRIICTGNFAPTNNDVSTTPEGRITATIEFTDAISKERILDNLTRIPLNPKYLDHKYNQYTYPIQNVNTRTIIKKLKAELAPLDFFFTGRFADWEYYNMDVAIGAAMDLCRNI